MENMENSTLISGTQLVKDNMPVQPETIIIVLAVFFVCALGLGIGFWLWSNFT